MEKRILLTVIILFVCTSSLFAARSAYAGADAATQATFENLKEGQTLVDFRTAKTGVYNSIYFDPAKVIQEFVQTNGEKPILDYALGLYYSDVLRRYSGRWLISDEELVSNTITYLTKAYENDCWDSWSMSELAYAYMKRGEYDIWAGKSKCPAVYHTGIL
ncbi:MAG: hypothetical protein K5907_03560 [Treponema sp.]|nr:hypothetical protein [Treponema sp.]